MKDGYDSHVWRMVKKMVRKLHLFTDGDFQLGDIHAVSLEK
jgi:hypothetical protein